MKKNVLFIMICLSVRTFPMEDDLFYPGQVLSNGEQYELESIDLVKEGKDCCELLERISKKSSLLEDKDFFYEVEEKAHWWSELLFYCDVGKRIIPYKSAVTDNPINGIFIKSILTWGEKQEKTNVNCFYNALDKLEQKLKPYICCCCMKDTFEIKNQKFLSCDRCKKVYYCGEDCKKENWPEHEEQCKKRDYGN